VEGTLKDGRRSATKDGALQFVADIQESEYFRIGYGDMDLMDSDASPKLMYIPLLFGYILPHAFPPPTTKGPQMRNIAVFSGALVFVLAGCASVPAGSESQSARTEVCKATSEQEVAALFDRWNQSLQTGDPHKVVANYAARSILLPTVSNTPRLTEAQKEDYFHHFLENKPVGKIDSRFIELGCNTAVDAGLYTFTFGKTGAQVKARYTYTYKWDGKQWLITSHHSSAMPEKG
jgi:uncharacterized protein (TIGR02246 family)